MSTLDIDPDTYQGLRPVQLSADGRRLRLLDQTRLPTEEVWVELDDLEAIARAIETLTVRGAPAIGCAAAIGLFALSLQFPDEPAAFRAAFAAAAERLANTRPTAVNLFVAIEQQRAVVDGHPDAPADTLRAQLRARALQHVDDDLRACLTMGQHGASAGCLPPGGVLTHCNTGALATAGHGTALGVIRSTAAAGTDLHVYVDETRPLLQGSRLTAWELMHDGIQCSLLCDNMAGALMARGAIQSAIVGADRIARNGDAANKIGTYTVAVLCKHHGIPFYVAVPWTTIDLSLRSGAAIPIEERGADEVRKHGGQLRAPADVPVCNPAFDVTPAELIAGIITERGVFAPSELARVSSP